jgi:hypothetical protein
MRWSFSLEKCARLFSAAALVVAMGFVPATLAQAGRPCYCPPPCYQDYSHQAPTDALPPSEDGEASPSDAPANQPQQPDIDFSQSAQAADALDVAAGNAGNMIGRLDANGRLNLFDSMSAIPRNRVWYSFMSAAGYSANLTPGLGVGPPLVAHTNMIVQRFGGEVKLWDSASLSVQAQTLNPTSTTGLGLTGGFYNPQFMAKQIVYADCDLVISGIFGVTPNVGFDATDIRDATTRLFPGMLFYQQWNDRLYLYGGAQLGIPTVADNITTFDWGVGAGYWVYDSCCCRSWLQRISIQYEIFGKHVLGDKVINNYFQNPLLLATYTEGRATVDMTAGGSVYLGYGVQVSAGYSFPVTTTDVRNGEFVTTVGYNF